MFILLQVVGLLAGAGWAAAGGGGDHGHESLKLGRLIVPLGLLTLAGLVTTFTLGRLLHRDRARFFPWHRRAAVATLLTAATHAALVLTLH